MPSQPLVPFGKLSSFYNSTYIETMVSYITSKLTEENICPHFPFFTDIVYSMKVKQYIILQMM